MPMTENGISTTTTPGQEQYEYYRGPKRPGKAAPKLCQYDYRHTDGTLFPKPVKLGPRTTAWKAEDIATLVEQLGKGSKQVAKSTF